MSVKITNNTSAPIEVRITPAPPAGPADLADWIDSDYLRRHPELLDELDELPNAADDIDNDERGLDFISDREPS